MDHRQDADATKPGGPNWLRFAYLPLSETRPAGRAELGLFGVIPPSCRMGPGPNWLCLTPTTRVRESGFDPRFWADTNGRFGRSGLLSGASCFARWVHSRLSLPTSEFTLWTSPVYTRPPNTGRVAGICTKKWVAPGPEIAVNPCPDAGKENLNVGPFQVLNCCTNKSSIAVSAVWNCHPVPTAPGRQRT